jgi:hypothetical protein
VFRFETFCSHASPPASTPARGNLIITPSKPAGGIGAGASGSGGGNGGGMLDRRPFTPPVAVAAPYSVVPPSASASASASAASSSLSPAQYNLNAIRASSAKPSPLAAANLRAAPRPGRSAIELNDDDVGSDIDDGDESVDQLLISNLAAATSRPASSVRLGAHSHSQSRSQNSHPPQQHHQQSSPADARVKPAALHLALPAASFRSAPAATFASMPVARPIMTPLAGASEPAAPMSPGTGHSAGHSPQSHAHSTPTTARMGNEDIDLLYGALGVNVLHSQKYVHLIISFPFSLFCSSHRRSDSPVLLRYATITCYPKMLSQRPLYVSFVFSSYFIRTSQIRARSSITRFDSEFI